MKTKSICLIVLLCLSIFAVEARETFKGNGKIETRTFQVGDFNQLVLGEDIEFKKSSIFGGSKERTPSFTYSQTNGNVNLKISMDENLFEKIVVKEEDGKLWIRAREETKLTPTKLIIEGSSTILKSVEIIGCMDFKNNGNLKTEDLRLSISGVGNVDLENLAASVLNCHLSGVGNFNLDGKADNAKYDVSGVGKVFAFDCIVKNLDCHMSGVGSMQVNASETLSAHASGVGNIYYKGDANVSSNASGVGKVKRSND